MTGGGATEVTVRKLGPPDAGAYQALRLRGLREFPSAFASAEEEEREIPLTEIGERLVAVAHRFTLGAFHGSSLIGIASVQREEPRKLAHKALVWGVFVSPEHHGRGVGRRLLEETLRRAVAIPGVVRVHLSVNAANVAATALYRAVGFRPFACEPCYMMVDGVPHDEVYMVYAKDGE